MTHTVFKRTLKTFSNESKVIISRIFTSEPETGRVVDTVP